MCGIAGFVRKRVEAPGVQALLAAMGDAIAHRGPDDHGLYEDHFRDWETGLIHRRLSIIDLSSGHQPIGNEDGSIQIIFNGEIYNYVDLRQVLIAKGHTFSTLSDTETIVHAYEEWGHECLKHLRGMFAFAIWDTRRKELFIARDRFGKKPLFIRESRGEIYFASEIKALLACPDFKAEIDRSVLADYFLYRYVPGPSTLFRGVRKLQPGSFAVWRDGRLTEHSYYQPPDGESLESSESDVTDPTGAFLDRLDESVRLRMVADVPFGAFLSGGIDSSAVVALMTRHSALPVKTYSVGFNESAYSELAYAKTVAQQFSTNHHELTISFSDIVEQLPAMIRFREAPISEPSDIPIFLLAKEARRTVKMVLTGEGSDEILGGYPKHAYERIGHTYRRLLPSALRQSVINPLVRSLPYSQRRAKTAIMTLGIEEHEARMARWFGAFSGDELRHLLSPNLLDQARATHPPPSSSDASALRRILHFDQVSWLPDNLLERGDRMTMAASIEARMPFMDHELAAFVSRLPDHFRVRGLQGKWILRQAMKQLLPSSILNRPKVGFRVPVNEWFRTTMSDFLRDHLLGSESKTRSYYQQGVVERLLHEHTSGSQNHEKTLWTLLNLEMWHREFNIA